METGKVEVSTGTSAMLAAALNKPITYFFPSFILKELEPEKLLPLEQELLIHFQRIWDEYLQKVAVDQVRVLGEFDPKDMIWDLIDIVADEKERREAVEKYLDDRKRKR